MSAKLLFVVLSTNPESEASIASIMSQANVAAAMGFDVEVIFSGQCDVLAQKGHGDQSSMVYSQIQAGHESGVSYKVCPRPEVDWKDNLLAEINEVIGGAYIISEAMDADTTSFTY